METNVDFYSGRKTDFDRYQRDVTPVRILIVDDEESILWALSQNLTLINDSFVIGTATSAEEALAVLDTSDIDIIITDLRLPKMDGLSLIREIQARSLDTRSILMTAYGSDEIAQSARECGVTAYIEKPFSIDLLICYLMDESPKEEEELCHPLEMEDLQPLKPAFYDRRLSDSLSLSRIRQQAVPSEVLRLQNERRPPKLVRDFSDEELELQPEPVFTENDDEDDDPMFEELFLPPDEDDVSEEQLKMRVKELVTEGIAQFKNYQLADAKTSWQRALRLDPNCTEAKKNLRILDLILKTKTC